MDLIVTTWATSDVAPTDVVRMHRPDVEPVFRISGRRNLVLETTGWSDKAAMHLAHQIARQPLDLRSHVQRVLLHHQLSDGDGLYSALVDLFIVLGDKGKPLRMRLLRWTWRRLSKPCYQGLQRCFDQGLTATAALPAAPGSVLSRGYQGSDRLVMSTSAKAGTTVAQEALDEARDYLEFGQPEEALKVLKQTIVMTPMLRQLHDELLEIYRHSRDRHDFLSMREKLRRIGNPFEPLWERLAESLDSDGPLSNG